MGTFLVSSTVFFTILTALAFGILLGYTVIVGILRLFGGNRRAPQRAAGSATAKLMAVGSTQ